MRVAVIGAGFSGLAGIKTCLDEKIDVVCFERENEIGGVWRYTEGGDKGSVCQSTVINTCKEMMSFSDFPIPDDYPMYMHNTRVIKYALSYVEEFGLWKYIRFNTDVVNVEQSDDYAASGAWMITHQLIGKEITSKKTERFDAVLVCSGHHWKKCYPSFPGMEKFNGSQIHSKEYRNVNGFQDKTVVVVGVGNSGGDIAVDLSRYAKKVYLSTRRGTWVSSRYVNGYPRDKYFNRRFLISFVPHCVKNTIAKYEINKRFDHKQYGLMPKHSALAQHPTVNEDLPTRILSGLVNIKPNIKRLNTGSIEFEDGSTVEDVDNVIYSTGFQFGFPFLDQKVLSVENNILPCYKYIFPVSLDRPTLAVIGFIQPLGAIMPISEMQCRVALKVFTKQCTLPSMVIMKKDVIEKEQKLASTYYASPRHTIQVNYIDYMDELAAMIGCVPNGWKLLFNDPQMWFHWYFGACIPAQFRLFGPDKWERARETVLRTESMTFVASKTRSGSTELASYVNGKIFIGFALLLAILYFFVNCTLL